MRRDYFTLDVDRGAGDATKPVATVSFDGPEDPFEDRLTDDSGAPLAADQVDVSYRLREGEELDSDATGAFAITDRITGDYVLEANVEAGVVLDLDLPAAEHLGGSRDQVSHLRELVTYHRLRRSGGYGTWPPYRLKLIRYSDCFPAMSTAPKASRKGAPTGTTSPGWLVTERTVAAPKATPAARSTPPWTVAGSAGSARSTRPSRR